jgi:hypothetical protein
MEAFNDQTNMMAGGAKKRGRKHAKKGGVGLTGVVSTGLLIAAEELYRNSLKKKGSSVRGGNDGASTAPVADPATEAATNAALDKLVGGRHRRRGRPCGSGKKKGGEGADSGMLVNNLDGKDGALISEAFGASLKGGKRHRKRRGGNDGTVMAAGDPTVAPSAPVPVQAPVPTQFNMNEVVAEASHAQEHVTGGKKRRGRKHRGGSEGAAVSELPVGANGDPMSGGKKRRGRKHRGGSDVASEYGQFSHAMNNPMPPAASTTPEMPVPPAPAQDGGKKMKRRTRKHRRGGTTDAPVTQNDNGAPVLEPVEKDKTEVQDDAALLEGDGAAEGGKKKRRVVHRRKHRGGEEGMDGGKKMKRRARKHRGGAEDGQEAIAAAEHSAGMSGMLQSFMNKLY